jgi:hypothetical protein
MKKQMCFAHNLAAMLACTTAVFAQDPISLQAYLALSRPAWNEARRHIEAALKPH